MCDLRLLRENGLTQLDKPEGTESVDDVIDFTCRCDVTFNRTKLGSVPVPPKCSGKGRHSCSNISLAERLSLQVRAHTCSIPL